MRILSVNQWDHFAIMIIGIAMLGFGVSGSLLVIVKEKLLKHAQLLIPLLMILSSICMLAAYRFSQNEYLKFDTFLVFSSTEQLLRLVLFTFLYFLPFFSASLAIGIIYVKHVSGIGKLYFLNLLGSGIGGIAGLVILHHFLPHNALIVATLFSAMAALFILPRKRKIILVLAYTLLLISIGWGILNPLPPALSQYKSLSKTLQLPDAEITLTKSGISSLVHIVESAHLRFAPGLSLHFTGKVPVKPKAFVNGNAAGFIPINNQNSKDILDYSTFKLPYLISEHQCVAVISSGTGTLVEQALKKGSGNIHAFESDVNLIRALDKWHENNHPSVYRNKAVTLHQIEARSYFSGNDEKFDLIVLPTMGSFGGTSGLQALKENYCMTIEAMNLYWEKLRPGGSLTITVYTDFPPRAPLKTIYSLVKMLKQQGIDKPQKHIAAVRSWTAITYVVSKEEINDDKIAIIRQFSADMGFDPFLLPDIEHEERQFFNYIEEEELFVLTDAIVSSNTEKLNDYLFYLTPASDNKPYFSRYIKISKLGELLKKYPRHEIPFLELGYIIVWLTFLIALVLSALFILLPVAKFRKSKNKIPILFYFGAIGLGFMFAQIIFIQRFVLYLGQPVLAVSAVLGIMLIASGTGSYFSTKILPGKIRHLVVFICICVILLTYALFLTPFMHHTAGLHMVLKVIIICVVVGTPAFFMGMPFPLGLQLVSINHYDKIAWAWGINGFFSVIATSLALIIAVEIGFFTVITLAAIAYLVALASVRVLQTKTK